MRRGEFVESVHRVHAVAVRDGSVVESAGDSSLPCSLRSCAKPFQALALVRSRDDLDDEDVAIASASHDAEPAQLEAAARLLAKAGAREEQLVVGHDRRNGGGGLRHNCSGKHAGMLAACAARGWPQDGYHRAAHPVQEEILRDVAGAADLPVDRVRTAVDGCGVLCFSVPLERAASMFARLEEIDGGARVVAAMRAHPELVGGEAAPDTELMRAIPGAVAKRGAEGAFAVRLPDGTGVALKVEDGGNRPRPVALAAFLARLGHDLPQWRATPLRGGDGEVVGEIAAAAARS